MFLHEVRDKIVSSPPIAVPEMLTSHCDNLSTYISSLFRHAISSWPHYATIFSRRCHVFKRKAKAIELPFCAKKSGKKKKRNCFFPSFISLGISNIVLARYNTNYQSEEWKLRKLGWNTSNSTVTTYLRHEWPTVIPGRTEMYMYRQIPVWNSVICHVVWSAFERYCYEVSWAVCL